MRLNGKFLFIAGPCVIENKRTTLEIAAYLKRITEAHPVQFVFKASFDKANRTRSTSYRGPGLRKGLEILEAVKNTFHVPILSDVHCVEHVTLAASILDIIQVPAFLCRQTDLIEAVARTKKIINIKKGQFLSPDDMRYVVEKAERAGNKNILISERGASFGYNNLVVDFRSFLIMKKFGYPIVYDATHSLQRPSAAGGISGGDRAYILPLARAAAACGVDGLFMEVHPRPGQALSDKHTSYPLHGINKLLTTLCAIRSAIR